MLFGAFGKVETEEAGPAAEAKGTVRSITPDELAVLFDSARSVIIVPGYGMAVAQAQYAVSDLAKLLMKRGIDVKYAIHPVAGRMPGHMNVLLAEANVPYDQLYEMEQINPYFAEADIALVVGANDVTNPAAKNNKSSPLYGMPILEVDRAKSIIVLKRSMRPGFAGVDNELYYDPKCMMLFGDAKESLNKLFAALKSSARPGASDRRRGRERKCCQAPCGVLIVYYYRGRASQGNSQPPGTRERGRNTSWQPSERSCAEGFASCYNRPEGDHAGGAHLMNQHKIGALVVIEDGRVVGMFTERDVLRRVVGEERDPRTTLVGDVMTTEVACCTPETTIDEARGAMKNRRVRHLPLVDDKHRLQGLISIGDLNAYLTSDHEQTIFLLQEYLYGRV